MGTPVIDIATSAPEGFECDVLVFLAYRVDGAVQVPEGAPVSAEQLEVLGFEGKRDELLRMPALEGSAARSIAVVGTGVGSVDRSSFRYAAGAAVRRLTGVRHVAICFPLQSQNPTEEGELLEGIAEGAALGGYSYTTYKSTSGEDVRVPAERVTILASSEGIDASVALHRASVSAEAICLVRDLVNEIPLAQYPETLANRVSEYAEGLPLQIEVWDEVRLAEDGFGGILGVGRGSDRPPRLVKVSYNPESARSHLAMVGKGITFDTGGLSLKPPASMIGMKYDMAGAATVFAVVRAAAQRALPLRVTAWLCLAENMPSGDAIRPGDVLTIHGGRTVEVLNTDAEGRLVLADGLVAASAEHPDAIVDVATLTGAVLVALGTRYVGTFGDDDLVAQVLDAARATDETLWPMPMPAELRPLLNSDIADIANVKPGSTAGGMLIAAHFLREFVGYRPDGSRIPWLHLDIAGAAQNRESGYGYTPKGPTGATVRTLLELAVRMSAE